MSQVRPRLLAAEIDRQLAPVLRQMEATGVRLETTYLDRLGDDLGDQIAAVTDEIFELTGHPFAIASPKQLSRVLFDELALGESDSSRKRRTTGFSTAAHALEQLREAHPIINLILRYRELTKLLTTYVRPLPQLTDSQSRLHTHYAPDAASGRLSSRHPNLQNIPIRTELGRQIRRAFVAEAGWQLVAADYSQIQLRIIAQLADDSAMLEVFRAGGDIHTATADALGVDRRTAKAVNFGMVYGLTPYGLSQSLQVPMADAQQFIEGFFGAYPAVRTLMADLITQARAVGYATTLHDKRRPLPDLTSGNDLRRRAAERIALNHPIQGTEAEIIKLAMLFLARAFADRSDIRLILQVHDELVFEVAAERVMDAAALIRTGMETAAQLAIPTPVEVSVGPNWAALAALATDALDK